VTLVVLSIVMAMVMNFVVDMTGAERKSVAKKRASSSAQTALDQLAADIRSITSRGAVKGGGQTDADRQFVLKPESLTTLAPAARVAPINAHVDLVAIGPRLLRFFVANGEDAQCVQYDAEATGRIIRTVSTNCAGPTTVVSRLVLLDPAPSSQQVAPFSFTKYDEAAACSPGPYPKPPAVLPAGGISALTASTATMRDLNQIATIKVDLRSNVVSGSIRGTTDLTGEFTIRNRVTDPYLRAIDDGCVAS